MKLTNLLTSTVAITWPLIVQANAMAATITHADFLDESFIILSGQEFKVGDKIDIFSGVGAAIEGVGPGNLSGSISLELDGLSIASEPLNFLLGNVVGEGPYNELALSFLEVDNLDVGSIGIHTVSVSGAASINNNPPVNISNGPTESYKVVPEPLSILGSGLALGFGAYFKREYSRKQKKAKTKAT